MDRRRIEALVREVLARHLDAAEGSASLAASSAGAPSTMDASVDFVAERDIMAARGQGSLNLTSDAIVTPLARETAERYGVELVRSSPSEQASVEHASADSEAAAPCAVEERGVIALGADHGGVALKDALRGFLEAEGWRPLDFGTHGTDAVDYPDFAHKVAGAVARGEARFGILVDGVGVGSCMAANRHQGVRAALGAGILEVTNAREHNDANVLCLGGRTMGDLLARAMTTVFLTTPHAGGRHGRRVQKIEPA